MMRRRTRGVRVLDLTRLLPGGSARCCWPTSAPTSSRSRTPAAATTSAGCRPTTAATRSARTARRRRYFLALNRNKRSIALEPQGRGGRDNLLRLVEDYDVLVESFRPGVMDRLGVGYEALRERTRASSTARSPATAGRPAAATARATTPNYLALAGLLGLTGSRGGPPIQSAGQIADLGGGGADGGGRHPGRAARARALRRGAVRRHLDDRRRAVVAGDGGRALLLRAARCRSAASWSWPAGSSATSLRDQGRRLGVARRARAEVLAELVRRRRARRT